jgi:membrane-bound lytic murein transglycosylase D
VSPAPLQIYLSQNVLLVLAYGLLRCLRFASARLPRPLAYRHQLHCAYWLIAAAVLAPLLAPLFSDSQLLPATAQVWSAPSRQALSSAAASSSGATLSLTTTGTQLRLDLLIECALTICAGGLAITLTLILIGARATRTLLSRAHLIRRIGALRILASSDASVPFSFWRPGSFFIVVPVSLLTRPEDLRIALRHEAQHHRQGDTWLVYVTGLLRGAFFLNPAAHALNVCVHELREFACDEAVIARHPVSARRYCDCLLWVAENALVQTLPAICMPMVDRRLAPRRPSGARASELFREIGSKPTTMLARRVEVLLRSPQRRLHTFVVAALQFVAVSTLLVTGIALAATVQDRRISPSEAAEMAAVARQNTSFPIVINPQVAAEMNRLVGTPDGRAYLRESVDRMRAHEPMIREKLRDLSLPAELLAIPLIESGYRNRPQDETPGHGAGIWMFVGPTARAFGLAVDASQDERLNPARETDAATRLLSQLMAEFGDWNLALLAYNGGSDFVNRSIREAGTRDAFELTQRGYENDPHYLARVMAAIIVMKNASRKAYY